MPVNDDLDPILRFGQVRRELEARWPETRIAPSLDRIRTLTQYLGDPQRAYPIVHVTGTNGKTSTARMIETLLREFGLHTGLITSPHLSHLRERICLDGEPIGVEDFLRVHDEVAPVLAMVDEASELAGGPRLSFFEVMTALGLAAFADAPVDVAVLEVGMGGTWDATNVADGQVAVVTAIGMDHTNYLGDTLTLIAGEKAGIIKPGASAVIGGQAPEVLDVLLAAARQQEAAISVEGVHFGIRERRVAVGGQLLDMVGLGGEYLDVFLPLFGEHQAHNAAVALAAVESFFGIAPPDPVLRAHDGIGGSPDPSATAADRTVDLRDVNRDIATGLPISTDVNTELPIATDVPLAGAPRQLDPAVVRAGFAAVASPGRLEVVRRAPTVLVDAAHNEHGARALAEAIGDSFSFTRCVGVIGVLADKDATGILQALDPVVDEVVITRSSSPRAIPVAELARLAADVLGEDRVVGVERLDEALERAIALAETGAPAGVGAGVLVTGSITVAGEARLLLGAESGHQDGATRSEHTAPRGRAQEDLG